MKYCINNTEESFKTFLGILEFDYVSTSTHFKLVDLMGANLNDINKEFFEISESGLINCVDRLWVYIDDYLMNDFIYLYTRQTGFGLSGLDPCTLSYKDCYHLVKRLTDKQDRTFYRHLFKALDNPIKYFKIQPNRHYKFIPVSEDI